MSDMDSLYGEVPPLEPGQRAEVSYGILDAFANTRDGKAIGFLYENYTPKVSYDIERAVRELRCSATGGAINQDTI